MRSQFLVGISAFSGGVLGAINLLAGASGGFLLSWPVILSLIVIGLGLLVWTAVN